MCPAVAYEMLVSHSPPVFSHSPPTSFLSDFANLRIGAAAATYPPATCRAMVPPSYKPVPKRPCLVIRPEDTAVMTHTLHEDPSSPTRLKKRVVFADDKGMSLTHVRVMTEPSNVPPLWSFRFLAEVTHGLSAEPEATRADPWEITFPQPASDYVDFRKRLDTNRVSLENVIVRECDDVIVGTVKVANLAFSKEVVIRFSVDGWKSHEDAHCKYVPAASTAYAVFDTFSFRIPMAPRWRRVDFCVCFRCEVGEFWDNNGGANYVIAKRPRSNDVKQQQQQQQQQRMDKVRKEHDVLRTKMDSWSEFASWTHLENSTPYW